MRSSCAAGGMTASSARQSPSAARSSFTPSTAAFGTPTASPRKRTSGEGWSSTIRRTPSSSINRRAVAGPTPSGSWSTRNQLTSSNGFSRTRSSDSASLTWAASRNFSPPYFTNGMFRRASSTSSRSE